jgi:hypothetical protein
MQVEARGCYLIVGHMMRLAPCLMKSKVGTSIIKGAKCFSTSVHEGCSCLPQSAWEHSGLS